MKFIPSLEQIAIGIVVAISGYAITWIWGLETRLRDAKSEHVKTKLEIDADIYAAFGTIQETEQRSIENEVRSKVNEELRQFLQDIISNSNMDRLEKLSPQVEHLEQLQDMKEDVAIRATEEQAQKLELEPIQQEEVQQQEIQIQQQVPINIDDYRTKKRRRYKK